VKRFGVSEYFLSDLGGEFNTGDVMFLAETLGMRKQTASTGHSQGNALEERMNQTMEGILRKYVDLHQTDWPEWLDLAEFAYNITTNRTTGETPFFLAHGFDPLIPVDMLLDYVPRGPAGETVTEYRENLVKQLRHVRDIVKVEIAKAQEKLKPAISRKVPRVTPCSDSLASGTILRRKIQLTLKTTICSTNSATA
jgi:hypothetical protein